MAELVGQLDVLGRTGGGAERAGAVGQPAAGPVADLGRFLARDDSLGGPVGLDLDRPHVVSIFGKRGSGKSYTLGVLAEELAETDGVTGVIVDPMGVFGGLADVGARVLDSPTIRPSAIPPEQWPGTIGLDPTSAAGSLVWRAAEHADTIPGMQRSIRESSADPAVVRTADTHLALADAWGCFDTDGLDADDLLARDLTVLDCSRLPAPARIAIVCALARLLYQHAVETRLPRLPWLLVDEAHACFTGAAANAMETLLTRGRQPGVSVALATQRPGSLPDVAISQTDLLVSHALTARADVAALANTQPRYLDEALASRLPSQPGNALIVDDASETVATIRVRERTTTHGGASPRASQIGHDDSRSDCSHRERSTR